MLFSFNSDEHCNQEGIFMESLYVLCQNGSQLLCILRKQKKTSTFCREMEKNLHGNSCKTIYPFKNKVNKNNTV